MDGRTMKGKVESIAGGVGRNIADCLSRLQLNPFLISTAGALEHARPLLNKMEHMDKNGITMVPDARTATCVVVLDQQGECLSVIGDMSVHDSLSKDQIQAHQDVISAAPLVILDGNVPPETMEYIFDICSKSRVPVWFEPTDVSRAFRPFGISCQSPLTISYASPNLNELRVMYDTIIGTNCIAPSGPESPLQDILDECFQLGSELLIDHLHTLVVTLGSHGAFLITTLPPEAPFPLTLTEIPDLETFLSLRRLRAVHYPSPKPKQIVSVSGAGDCFAAGMIGSILKGSTQHECILAGQRAALLSLASHHAVPDTVIPEVVSPKAWDPVVAHTVII